jgi:hypothetical protein
MGAGNARRTSLIAIINPARRIVQRDGRPARGGIGRCFCCDFRGLSRLTAAKSRSDKKRTPSGSALGALGSRCVKLRLVHRSAGVSGGMGRRPDRPNDRNLSRRVGLPPLYVGECRLRQRLGHLYFGIGLGSGAGSRACGSVPSAILRRHLHAYRGPIGMSPAPALPGRARIYKRIGRAIC